MLSPACVSLPAHQFDIAGFPKPHAFWYAANWAQGFNGTYLPGRPPLLTQTVTRFLDLPHAPSTLRATAARPQRSLGKETLYSISTAPFSELLLDGVSQGVKPTPRNERGEIEARSRVLASMNHSDLNQKRHRASIALEACWPAAPRSSQ